MRPSNFNFCIRRSDYFNFVETHRLKYLIPSGFFLHLLRFLPTQQFTVLVHCFKKNCYYLPTLSIFCHCDEYFLFAPPHPNITLLNVLCVRAQTCMKCYLQTSLSSGLQGGSADGIQTQEVREQEEGGEKSFIPLAPSLPGWLEGATLFFQSSGLLGALPPPTASYLLWALEPFHPCSAPGLQVLTLHPFNCFH